MSTDTPREPEYRRISNRSISGTALFREKEDFERFLALLHIANSDAGFVLRSARSVGLFEAGRVRPFVDVIAYRLAPEGYSIVLAERRADGLRRFVHKVSTGYAMYYNRKYRRDGPIFRGAYRAEAVPAGRLREALRSVHLGPAGAELRSGPSQVEAASLWEYSSMRDYLGEDRPQRAILTMLGGI